MFLSRACLDKRRDFEGFEPGFVFMRFKRDLGRIFGFLEKKKLFWPSTVATSKKRLPVFRFFELRKRIF